LSSTLLAFVNRTIPQVEIEAVSEFLFHLLRGDVDKLRTETLVHSFWAGFAKQHKQISGYFTCLRKHRLDDGRCYHTRSVGSYCGNSRFGQKTPQRLEQCRLLLANKENATTLGVAPNIAESFAEYRLCFQKYRRQLTTANCTNVFREAITSRRLRTTKVVRATMSSMGPLLRSLPTLRIIHLVRDPRAVALSRIRFGDSGLGAYTMSIKRSTSGIVAEASLYCHHVTADIRSRLALEREFPGRILSVRYEDVVANPEQRFRDIYKFLDEPMPNATLDEMQKMAREGQAMNLTTKWQSNVKYIEAVTVARLCAEFYHLMNISPTES